MKQATPMLCIPKKNGKLWTVFDLRLQNANTVKDVTPFLDQDAICHDMARAPYRSKLDLSEGYKQVQVIPKHIHSTGFATVLGTFVSRVLQQGDCNGPSTFQQMMTTVFCDGIGRFVYVYIDDIFVYSFLLEEHDKHLGWVFDKLRESHLFLTSSRDKIDLYSSRMECLGHIIDDQGIHADADKMSRIREWRRPRTFEEVQRFLGLVQYLAHYMPDLSAYTTPLLGCTRNNHPFQWTPLLDKCFQSIKVLACKAPILKPIDFNNPDPVWVVTDGSKIGIGAVYGQGQDWCTCHPAGFLSKKFSNAQQHYRTHEHKTITVLEALMKWEDKLLGQRFTLVTDHKGLEYFLTQPNLSARQARWWEFLSRFDYDTVHVPGETNRVADCLSRYYESDGPNETHPEEEYVNADKRLDPEGKTLPTERFVEIRTAGLRHSECLKDKPQQHVVESNDMNKGGETRPSPIDMDDVEDMCVMDTGPDGSTLRAHVEKALDITRVIKMNYGKDSTFSKVLQNPEAHPRFGVRDGLVWTKNQLRRDVICISHHGFLRGRILVKIIIDQAHKIIGHFSQFKTSNYI